MGETSVTQAPHRPILSEQCQKEAFADWKKNPEAVRESAPTAPLCFTQGVKEETGRLVTTTIGRNNKGKKCAEKLKYTEIDPYRESAVKGCFSREKREKEDKRSIRKEESARDPPRSSETKKIACFRETLSPKTPFGFKKRTEIKKKEKQGQQQSCIRGCRRASRIGRKNSSKGLTTVIQELTRNS